MKKQWFRFKYELGLCVLLLLLLHVGALINFVLHVLFNIPYDSLSADIAEIVIHAAVFAVVIGVGLKDQKKTLASVCFFKKVSWGLWGAALLSAVEPVRIFV